MYFFSCYFLNNVLKLKKRFKAIKQKKRCGVMDFNVNAPILFVLVGIIVAFVLAQSAFFLWLSLIHI